MKATLIVAMAVVLAAGSARAELVRNMIAYEEGGATLRSYLVFDDAVEGERPGVLVIPEWWGLNEYAKGRADELAQMGYIALAADMYGDARVTTDTQQAGAWSGEVKGSELIRTRSRAALEQLREHELSQDDAIAAIGFCFGGTTVLELAYSGARLNGVVSFHGGLTAPKTGEAQDIEASILVLHGAEDNFVTPEEIETMAAALNAADVDWQMNIYGNAVHSFSNPGAGKAGLEGVAYDAKAAARGWLAMQTFFNQIFSQPIGKLSEPDDYGAAFGE